MVVKIGDLGSVETVVEEVITKEVAKVEPPVKVDYTQDPRTQVSKFPIEPSKPTDVIGVDYDPYDVDYGGYDQHSDVWNSNIPFHNYRQRHVSQQAFYAGYGSTLPLPKCPPLWGDVSHYWNSMCLFGWICYEIPRVGGGVLLTLGVGFITSFGKAHGWM